MQLKCKVIGLMFNVVHRLCFLGCAFFNLLIGHRRGRLPVKEGYPVSNYLREEAFLPILPLPAAVTQSSLYINKSALVQELIALLSQFVP